MPEVIDGAFGVASVVACVELLIEPPVGPSAGVPVEFVAPAAVAALVVLPGAIAPAAVAPEAADAGFCTLAPTP